MLCYPFGRVQVCSQLICTEIHKLQILKITLSWIVLESATDTLEVKEKVKLTLF